MSEQPNQVDFSVTKADKNIHSKDIQYGKEISPLSLKMRENILDTERFFEYREFRPLPSPTGLLYEVGEDIEGNEWHVIRENGFVLQSKQIQNLTTFDVNECFVAILEYHNRETNEISRLLAHSNPFIQISPAEPTDLRIQSPFIDISEQLQAGTIPISFDTLQLIYKPSVNINAIEEAERYMLSKYPTIKLRRTQTPIDKTFDVQMVGDEITGWKQRSLEGFLIDTPSE